MFNYLDIINKINSRRSKSIVEGIKTPLPRLTSKIGYIDGNSIIGICGRPTSGKISFMDYFFLDSIFKHKLENPDSKIKIFYFGSKNKILDKIQKLTCLFYTRRTGIVIDPITLDRGVSRLKDMDDNDMAILGSFTNDFNVLNNIMTYYQKPLTPTDMDIMIKDYIGTIGSFDNDNNYILNPNHKDTKIFIFIENINNFIPETDKSNTLLNERGMAKRFGNLFKTYKSYNCITTIFVHPTDSFKGRNARETEPSYKDLGFYSDLVDLGLCIYNPYAESNYKYFNYKINEFFINNKDRFRSVTVVKSNKSSAFITSPLIFLGENGAFKEAPLPQMEADIQEVQDQLRRIGIPISQQDE